MTWKWENSHKSIAIGKIVSRMYSFQQGRILTVGLSTFVYCASLCLITCLLRTADGFITADNWRVDSHVTCGWRGCNYPLLLPRRWPCHLHSVIILGSRRRFLPTVWLCDNEIITFYQENLNETISCHWHVGERIEIVM